MAVSASPSMRMRDFGRLVRLWLRSLGPMRKKKYSIAMLIDEIDLELQGFKGFKLVKEVGFRPVNRVRSPMGAEGIGGITGQREFLRQDPLSDVVVRVTPFSTARLAIHNVERASDSIVHDPTRGVAIPHSQDLTDLRIEGLETVFAHEESIESGNVKYQVLMIFSHVGQVHFSIQVSSRSDVWNWENAVLVAAIQADKIRRTMSVLTNIF